jgi:crossover junction endodeoxyribonuclease RusA
MVVHGRPWTANDRVHWRTRALYTRTIRESVAWVAKSLHIGPQAHITVGLHYQPGDSRRRDAPNLTTSQKPSVDGLRDAGIVPDDTAEFVTELMPVIHPGKNRRALWLEIEATP